MFRVERIDSLVNKTGKNGKNRRRVVTCWSVVRISDEVVMSEHNLRREAAQAAREYVLILKG